MVVQIAIYVQHTANLDEFLDEMKHNKEPKVRKVSGAFYN